MNRGKDDVSGVIGQRIDRRVPGAGSGSALPVTERALDACAIMGSLPTMRLDVTRNRRKGDVRTVIGPRIDRRVRDVGSGFAHHATEKTLHVFAIL